MAVAPIVGFWCDYVKDLENNHWLKGTQLVLPASLYVGLSSSFPNRVSGGFFDITGSGYARVLAPAASWTTSTGGLTRNSVVITFPTATGNWTKAYSAFLIDGLGPASSGGPHVLAAWNLIPDSSGDGVTILTGQVASFAINAISIQR